MKRKLSYLMMSLLFFNVLFLFYFYFKIVDFLYINFMNFSVFLNVVLTNVFILIFNIFYIILYYVLKLYKLSYLYTSVLGAFIGFFVGFLVLGNKFGEVSNYMSIISFFVIDIVFISYSLYFDEIKKNVFD